MSNNQSLNEIVEQINDINDAEIAASYVYDAILENITQNVRDLESNTDVLQLISVILERFELHYQIHFDVLINAGADFDLNDAVDYLRKFVDDELEADLMDHFNLYSNL